MALQLTKTFSDGSSGNYWRITKGDVDIKNVQVVFNIECWKDVSYRLAGAPSLFLMDLVMANSDFADQPYPENLAEEDIYTIGYAGFKLLDYFSGAVDV